jgi:hypothetical protein
MLLGVSRHKINDAAVVLQKREASFRFFGRRRRYLE